MVKSLYDEMKRKGKEGGSGKLYALVLVVVVLVCVIGFLLYAVYGGLFPLTERVTVTNPEEAASTFSELEEDMSDISEDLKDIGNLL